MKFLVSNTRFLGHWLCDLINCNWRQVPADIQSKAGTEREISVVFSQLISVIEVNVNINCGSF